MQQFKAHCFTSPEAETAELVSKGFDEPVEAVSAGEDWLQKFGSPGKSLVKVYFNGSTKPHYKVYLMDDRRIGLLNMAGNSWPVEIPEEDPNGIMLPDPDYTLPDEGDSDAGGSDGEGGNRVKLFMRARARIGWGRWRSSKRFETDTEVASNRFEVAIGILDERWDRRSMQESKKQIVLEVVEREAEPGQVSLIMRLPTLTNEAGERTDYEIEQKNGRLFLTVPITED